MGIKQKLHKIITLSPLECFPDVLVGGWSSQPYRAAPIGWSCLPTPVPVLHQPDNNSVSRVDSFNIGLTIHQSSTSPWYQLRPAYSATVSECTTEVVPSSSGDAIMIRDKLSPSSMMILDKTEYPRGKWRRISYVEEDVVCRGGNGRRRKEWVRGEMSRKISFQPLQNWSSTFIQNLVY